MSEKPTEIEFKFKISTDATVNINFGVSNG